MERRLTTVFVLGATGFIGREVVIEARRRGLQVKALVRDAGRTGELAATGTTIVEGDAQAPLSWIQHAAGCDVLIDLVQPELPERITRAAIEVVARRRLEMSESLLSALRSLPAATRPVLFSVSGVDDLLPDDSGQVDHRSPLRTRLVGFAHIGVPVRRAIEVSEVRSAFVYLGTVYGPGKAFARTVFPRLAQGRFRMAGSGRNRMPLVHVEDAARALVHLASLPLQDLPGRSFIVADGSSATMARFLGHAARLMGAPPPRTAPAWAARLVAGTVLYETVTRDVRPDPAALVATGFAFRYPSFEDGLPPTLHRLGLVNDRISPSLTRGFLDNPRTFRGLSILAPLLLITANVVVRLPRISALTSGLPILDMRLWYSERDAYHLLDVLGPAGRTTYLTLQWTLDLVAPIVFGTFLASAMARGRFRRLAALGLLAAAFDYAENIAIARLLLGYPAHFPTIARVGALFTSLKWACYAAATALAVAGFVSRHPRANTAEPGPRGG